MCIFVTRVINSVLTVEDVALCDFKKSAFAHGSFLIFKD